MSTERTTIEIIASTDRGDVGTRVLAPQDLPVLLAEILAMAGVGTVTVEVAGIVAATGEPDDRDALLALTV